MSKTPPWLENVEYTWIHTPTGKTGRGKMWRGTVENHRKTYPDIKTFQDLIDHWNRLDPKTWQYVPDTVLAEVHDS